MSFRFKQFFVHDELCAMKVGTDGVLLGAWAASLPPLGGTEGGLLLDIGTGSWLIALMLAQRFPTAHIHAIDIDANAVQQAQANFTASPWTSRLHAENISLQKYYRKENLNSCASEYQNIGISEPRFDIITSNPPFFCNSLKNPDAARSTARHTDSLSYEELLQHSARLLADEGTLSLILPIEAEDTIIRLAQQYQLFPVRLCRIRGNLRKPFKRIMIDFQKKPDTQCIEETLTLEEAPNQRSEAYQALTQDFYL